MLNTLLFAQTLKGTITDLDTGKPIVGANILLVNTFKGASTNLEGFYEINNIKTGKYAVEVLYTAYCTHKENILIDSSKKVFEYNFVIREFRRNIGLNYPKEYLKYQNRIKESYAEDKSIFLLTFEKEIRSNGRIVIIHPKIKNKFSESIFLPDKVEYYSVFINGKKLNKIKSMDLFGCSSVIYSPIIGKSEVIAIKPDSVSQIHSFFFSINDLPNPDIKEIEIKIEYIFKLPNHINADICSDKLEKELKNIYSKILALKLESNPVIIKLK